MALQIENRYILICGIGEKSEPPPIKIKGKRGRYKRTKGRNLVERLIREQDAVLAFAFVLLPVQKSMPGLKDLFQPPENIIRMFFLNYALPLRNIILLLDK